MLSPLKKPTFKIIQNFYTIKKLTTSFFFLFLIIVSLLVSSNSHAAKKKTQLKPTQKRLFTDASKNKCFYFESVRKSEKFGWINDDEAKKYSRIKRKPVLAANSPKDVRKVLVPRNWCQKS